MQDSVILIIVGGALTLVSSLATTILQHWLSLRKEEHETRRYPREVLFKKQTEFFDRVTPILQRVNEYITTIDVWLGGASPDAEQKVQEAAKKTGVVWEFHELMERFSMYLPDKMLLAGNALLGRCLQLSRLPTMKTAECCIRLLISFQNIIRECVGVDKLSEDLFKAFGVKQPERPARSD